jgi:hypothetical protein
MAWINNFARIIVLNLYGAVMVSPVTVHHLGHSRIRFYTFAHLEPDSGEYTVRLSTPKRTIQPDGTMRTTDSVLETVAAGGDMWVLPS